MPSKTTKKGAWGRAVIAEVHLNAAAPKLLAFVRREYATTLCICKLKKIVTGSYLAQDDLPCTHCEAGELIKQAEGRTA